MSFAFEHERHRRCLKYSIAQGLISGLVLAVCGSSIAATDYWIGTVYPSTAVSVKSDLDGVVAQLHAVIGQHVRRGQVIAKLEQEELETQLSRSSAELRMARAQVAEEESMVELRDAELHRRRIAGLSISEEELGMAEQLFAAAKATLTAAHAHLEAIQADHELLLLKERRTAVVAPIAGVIQERRVRSGDRVNVGETMFEIVHPEGLYVRFATPENERIVLDVGQTVWLDNEVAAEVIAVAPGANAVTGLIVAEARLIDGGTEMLGRGVRVTLEQSPPVSASGMVGE